MTDQLIPLPFLNISPEGIAKRIEDGKRRIKAVRDRYSELSVYPHEFGQKQGPFHAGSILAWARIAELAGIPLVPAKVISRITIEDAWALVDHKPLSPEGTSAYQAARTYAQGGGFWRTDQCAGEEVKYKASTGSQQDAYIPFHLDDPRIMDFNVYMPEIIVVGRPRVTPVMVGGYAAEFRVFQGGAAQSDYAASFYYPQATPFEVTPHLEKAMDLCLSHAAQITTVRRNLGLTPWLPERGDPDESIGSTIDFMITQEMGLVMIDAGPGAGYGAHPCCFLNSPIQGKRWRLADGVTLR